MVAWLTQHTCEMVSVADESAPCVDSWDGTVRSLYAMLRFYAARFAKTYRVMGGMRHFLEGVDGDDIDDRKYRLLSHWIDSLSMQLSPLNLPVSRAMLERLRNDCKNKYSAMTLSADLDQLFTVLEVELSSVKFVQILKHRQYYYDLVPLNLDEKVVLNLPTVISDLEEGSKCFAVGRNTACVFHLMRVMEISVQILGKKLRVKLVHQKNWQNIIDEVNKAIKNMNTKTARQKILQSEYGAIAAHLFNVKIAWRNPVMHPKTSYTEEEAEDVLKHVIVFVNYLSRILKK